MGWKVLSLYAALTAHNQMVWICFSPIKDKTGIFFGLGEDLIIVDFASTLYDCVSSHLSGNIVRILTCISYMASI